MVTAHHAAALALVDDLALAGVRIAAAADGGITTVGDVPGELGARIRLFLGEGPHRAAQPPHRAFLAVLRAPTRGLRELLTLPVAFARLPLPYAVTFARKQVSAVFTTSQPIHARERVRQPVFVLREFDAAALAVEAGRAGPAQLDRWLASKRGRADWLLTPEEADLPRREPGGDPPKPACTFGDLFDALGAEVTGLELQETAPVAVRGAA